MDIQTCAENAPRPDSDSADLFAIWILGEVAAKCDEIACGIGEVECPQKITEALRLIAQILGAFCHSAIEELSGPEIEEPEPEPESEPEAEPFEPEPEPELEPEYEPFESEPEREIEPFEPEPEPEFEPGEPEDEQDDECDEVVVGIEPGGCRIWG